MYDHDAFAADLRRHPNLWTFFPDMPTSAGAARQLAYSINRGDKPYAPAGAYIAFARTIDGDHLVIAKFCTKRKSLKAPLPPLRGDILTHPIEDMGLPTRPYNCLKRAGINSIGELVARTDADLRDIQGLGSRSYQEVKARLTVLSRVSARCG